MSGRRIQVGDRRYDTIELMLAWSITSMPVTNSVEVGSAIEASHAFVFHAAVEAMCGDACEASANYRRLRILDVAYACREAGCSLIGYHAVMAEPDIWTAVWPVVVGRLAP